jgi:ABC-type glycerol-3-phosphate transport system permease component
MSSETYYRVRKILERFLTYGLLALFSFIFTFPFFWTLLTSLKSDQEIYTSIAKFFPRTISFQQYVSVWQEYKFGLHFYNSTIVAFSVTFLTIVIASFAAYAIVRMKFRGQKNYDRGVLFIYLTPAILLVIPLFMILSKVGLYNTRLGLVLACTTFALPFCIWLLKAFIREIPLELEEAAAIDGASRMQIFSYVVVPLALPGIIATAIFAFILAWNDYLFALVILTSDEIKTYPLAINALAQGYENSDGKIMAMSVMAAVPVVFLFMFIQKYLIKGLSAGAVKG